MTLIMVTDDSSIAAWWALHELLATMPGWVVNRPQRDPLTGAWRVVAYKASVRGRGRPRPSCEGAGATEAEAVASLAELLGAATL